MVEVVAAAGEINFADSELGHAAPAGDLRNKMYKNGKL